MSMTKIADPDPGYGSGSGSISQRDGSEDPDPDPPQNVMDPQHCFLELLNSHKRTKTVKILKNTLWAHTHIRAPRQPPPTFNFGLT